MDALALRAEEGRDKLRYSRGSSKYALIPWSPNGETHDACIVSVSEYIAYAKVTQRTETSKYLQEKKIRMIP